MISEVQPVAEVNEDLKAYVAQEKPESEIADLLAALRRDDVSKPTIYIGTGTCGLGAGAGETLKAIRAYLENKKVDAEIVEGRMHRAVCT